jgi:hypothetical protein
MPYKRRKRSVWSIIRTVPDIEEGDSEHGRGVREQGEGLTGWDYDDSGFCPEFLRLGLKKQVENGII